MKTLEKSITVEPLHENKQTSMAVVDDKDVFQLMEQNLSEFMAIEKKSNSYLPKLAFISSILRTFNLKKITVEQNFHSPYLNGLKSNFVFTVLAEPAYSDQKPEKDIFLARFEELKDLTQQEVEVVQLGNLAKEEAPSLSIREQKESIKELFFKVLEKIGGDREAAIALTSFFVFELEVIQQHNSNNFIAFYEMYNTNNPHDKWFAAIDIYYKGMVEDIILH